VQVEVDGAVAGVGVVVEVSLEGRAGADDLQAVAAAAAIVEDRVAEGAAREIGGQPVVQVAGIDLDLAAVDGADGNVDLVGAATGGPSDVADEEVGRAGVADSIVGADHLEGDIVGLAGVGGDHQVARAVEVNV